MEQQTPSNSNSTPQPTEPQQSQSSSAPSLSPSPISNPNPNFSQLRPPFNRPWQQQQSSSPVTSTPPPVQRGGIAMGVPAPQSAAPFSSFGQQFGGLGRNPVNSTDSVAGSSSSQARQPMQGYQNTGMSGSLGSGSLLRPGGISTLHQSRPVQPSARPQSTLNNQSSATQNFQGHGLLRGPSVGSPGSPSINASQTMSSHNQPWLSSGSQGKPPLPSPTFRAPMNAQSLQQRSHIPQHQQQHHHSLATTSPQQQHMSTSQQSQPSPLQNQQENHGQQLRAQQSLPHQQLTTSRVQGAANQKPSSLVMIQSSAAQVVPQGKPVNTDPTESCNRILSKRSIHELLNQIDPSEKLDPEVEDALMDIADEFVESITAFGCSLAKHRKSSTLEAKDILLHLEKNWNMTLPGFSGDEIKSYKKPITNDIHRERLATIKKSMVGSEMINNKISSGQAVASGKALLTKAPANAME